MRQGWLGSVAAAAVAALLLAACADDGDEGNDVGGATSSSSPLAGVGEPPGDDLVDGTHFGYLVELEPGDAGAVGQFDLAQLTTGEAAAAAAAAEGKRLEGDHHISNVNPRLRRIEVAPSATTSIIGEGARCCDPIPTSLDEFFVAFEPPLPVVLTIEDGSVTDIAEQYFP